MPNVLILVVDDEPINLEAMRLILADDFRVATANSGQEALIAARQLRPNLILLDIDMPDLSGYEVCRRLKVDPGTARIPVIFVTSLEDIGHETEGFAAGGVDYITKPVSPPIVQARVRTHLSLVHASQLEQSWRDAIGMLGEAGHYNDTDTGIHIWRMAAYARALAEACGWDTEQAALLEQAAPMHDTGKIGIPSEILKKPAKLTEDEWVIIRTHTTIGRDILARSTAPVFLLAAEVALRHHEKWDGSGYPDGLRGEMIPESARIVALADVFDALSMRRPYKEPWPLERIMATLHEGSGSHFEPRLVILFEQILPEILHIRDCWNQLGD
mgnify:CR=1 FL=1